MGPPSFGGIVVLQILQMLEARAGGRFDFNDAEFVHLYAEAGRLAQADRRRYVGDPGFVTVPTVEMVAPSYVQERARLIDPAHANLETEPGRFEPAGAPLSSDARIKAGVKSLCACL